MSNVRKDADGHLAPGASLELRDGWVIQWTCTDGHSHDINWDYNETPEVHDCYYCGQRLWEVVGVPDDGHDHTYLVTVERHIIREEPW